MNKPEIQIRLRRWSWQRMWHAARSPLGLIRVLSFHLAALPLRVWVWVYYNDVPSMLISACKQRQHVQRKITDEQEA